jgi:N-acyl-phosphatidylethanolamine-hydrolysing phospholipase D
VRNYPAPARRGPRKGGARQRRYTGLVEPHPRRRARRSARWAALIVLVLLGGGPSLGRAEMDATAPGPLAAARLAGSHYVNQDPKYNRGAFSARLRTFVTGMTWLVAERRVAPLHQEVPDLERLRATDAESTVTWVGHSTLLVQLDGLTILTDPTWSKVSGPFGVIGVHRYTPPGVPFEALPRVDVVLISHDHYDHLDAPTVERLARTFNPRFVVPRRLEPWFRARGMSNVVELNWGESVAIGGVQIVCTPAQHGGGRTLMDQSERLWASWAVLGSKRFYFGGDTGYYRHFKDIGDTLGPFDLAALPIGSYTPRETAKPVHISPEEALQAFTDLRATTFVGIHWGTFALAREPYDEPPKRIAAEVARRGLPPDRVWILPPGQTVTW